jgi:hypothetical protein
MRQLDVSMKHGMMISNEIMQVGDRHLESVTEQCNERHLEDGGEKCSCLFALHFNLQFVIRVVGLF